MKIIKRTLLTLVIVLTGVYMAQSQTTRKEKKAAKEAEIKNILQNKTYTFNANTANPLGWANRQLTYGYDLLINKDSVVAYLPYFGRAYVAPINPDDAGIQFTSTKFSYTYAESKNGYEVSIKPTDTKDVQMMYLSISLDGYATLRIRNLNRDPISFDGYVEANKKPKVKAN